MTILIFFTVFAAAFFGSYAAVLRNDNNVEKSFSVFQDSGNRYGRHCWQPQLPEISNTSSQVYENIKKTLEEVQYQAESIARFKGAIRVETQVNDDFGDVKDDNRWSKFYHFSAYLADEFPLVHKKLRLERINDHGLLYTWESSSDQNDNSVLSKPFLLLAHQDTVPVSNETISDWKFDPFAGHIDKDGVMYGRGVHDDKNSLISILEGVELLLQHDFKPSRTVLLAFGFDEEVSGRRGALEISKFLEHRYGKNSIEFILDEGPGIVEPLASESETVYATVATAEKGYLDVSIEARAPGGHSSLAGQHSLIGIMAEIVMSLENSQPFLPRVSRSNPALGFLSCYNFGDEEIQRLLDRIHNGDPKAEYELGFLLQNTSLSITTRTSQAIDLISGGQKINALPERVSIAINYRISPDSSLREVKERLTAIVKPIAVAHNLTCDFFSRAEEPPASEKLLLVSQIGKALEPAKMSPQDSKAYSVILGTVSSALGPVYTEALNAKSLLVVPTLMAGNTDTRHFWNLTGNLFRFRPTRIDVRNNGGHTVNEHLHASDHFAAVLFYTSLILNASEM